MPVEMTSLALTPDTVLSFTRTPADNTPKRVLKLANTTGMNVAFKVKTTAPKCYLVKPSSGNLARGGSIDIQITLQPDKGDATAPASHRFLVQAHPVDHESQLQSEQWADIPKDAIQEKRLSVVLEDSADPSPAPTRGGGAAPGAAPAASTGGTGMAPPKVAVPETYSELKDVYDRQYSYIKKVDDQKKSLEAELQSLKQERGGATKTAAGGMSAVHLVIVFILTVLLSFFFPKIKGLVAPGSPQ